MVIAWHIHNEYIKFLNPTYESHHATYTYTSIK